MAYSFNGTNQRLSIASAPVTAAPLTLFLRANSSTAQIGRPLSIVRTTVADRFELLLPATSYPATVQMFVSSASPAVSTTTAALSGIAQNTWVALTGLEESSTSRYAFLDTTKSNQNTTSVTPDTPTQMAIGARAIAAAFFAGLLGEVATWNAALTDDEVTSLARGFKPFRIRPQSLQFYAPIVRDLQDLRGGLTITNNNAATVADHPRVY